MASKIKVDETVKGNIEIVYDLLGAAGVESFVVSFDGNGDDGQVEEPCEFKPARTKKKAEALLGSVVEGARVSNGTRWHPNGGKETMWKENPTLNELIDSFCYEALESVCSGWEINEGSHGSFYFDVKKREMNLDFNERVVESNLSQYSL